jgi:hypothetical protein
LVRPKVSHFILGLAVLSVSLTLGLPGFAQNPGRVKVIIDNANVRSRPELEADILEIVAKGAVFEVIEKTGPWYAIKWGTDESGKTITGYIHESMVELIGGAVPELQPAPEPPAAEPPPPPARKPSERTPSREEIQAAQLRAWPKEKLISGSFIKYGFGDHWVVSFGADLGIGRHFGIGLEFQPTGRRDTEAERSVIQMNIFANAKLGFRLGLLTVYGGGGAGPHFLYDNTETQDESFSKFSTMAAYHGVFGVALNIEKIAVVFEYQPTLVADPDIDPDRWGHFFFVGLRL